MKGPIVLALLGCVAYVGYIVLPSAPERPVEAPTATSVSVVHPLRKDLASVIEVTGSLMASQEVQVHSLVAGYVKDIRVDIGDHVKGGDLIATLEVINVEGQLQAAKDANRGLGPPDMGAGQGATATPETATPEAATLVASPGAAAPKVSNTSIFAPFSGVITQRNVDTGTLVQTGVYSSTQSLPLVTLAQDDLLRASFPVPETALGKFRIGEEIEIDIPVLKRKITGKIARSSNQIASATRTMDVEVDIPNPDLSLTLGLYAIAAFPLERAQGALSLPVQAIRTPDDPSVLVISGAGLLEQRPVKLGVETPSFVQVVSGVSETDLVVLGNASELEPGMKVAPFESQDPAAPSPAAK